ncbi:hypothetical protein M413DRAFT_9442 [Hebeloma cylindrosporum]|uniref:C2H2-type domain-containing protein n=1 Tax=Hebeloma cylindrosporum TaxID=76867 RepID=A0A0C3C607_HEBCY|nr:hypothetical protein M413DRAFT_9442 [Hebeloma cylindrosporum h7]
MALRAFVLCGDIRMEWDNKGVVKHMEQNPTDSYLRRSGNVEFGGGTRSEGKSRYKGTEVGLGSSTLEVVGKKVYVIPIALSQPSSSQDYTMQDPGSYTGSTAEFNPASFTRHFLGSPISWRAGSFGAGSNRFPAGSPTAQLLSSIDLNEFRSGKTPSSIESDSIMNALNVFDREGEFCRNYTCCGLHLNDLHALLEHFEQVHIVVLDPTSAQPQAHIQIPFNPQIHEIHENDPPARHHHYAQFDPDDMELDLDLDNSPHAAHPLPPPPPPPSSRHSSARSSPSSCAPSPPDTPISTPLSAYPSPHNAFVPGFASPYVSQPPSPLSTPYDVSSAPSTRQRSPTFVGHPQHRPNLALNLSSGATSSGFPRHLANPEEAFNPYARFASDYSSSMPGAQFNAATVDEASAINNENAQVWVQDPQQLNGVDGAGCVPPALLFGGGEEMRGKKREPVEKPHAQTAPPTPILSPQPSGSNPAQPPQGVSNPHSQAASLPRPASSLLMSKPFRCPKPNCNKSYKQANGLKYHMTHGSCNFAPPKDLEHVKDLLERKRREREQQAAQGSGLTRSASLGSPSGSSSAYAPTPLSQNSAEDSSIPGTPLSPTSILSLTYSDLSNISESDLREVEREAERRLRPFACGVGECTRRYKNMNGLRYHYQHSGDHGSVGLALLASGQHECLGAGKRGITTGAGYGGGGMGVHRTTPTTSGMKGSLSTPVSRAGSISLASSRVGTPQPGSGGGATTTNLKTTAIMPTTVQAQAFVVPSTSTHAHSRSGSASGYHSPHVSPVMQQQPSSSASSPASVSSSSSSPPTSAAITSTSGLATLPAPTPVPAATSSSTSPHQIQAHVQQQQYGVAFQQHQQAAYDNAIQHHQQQQQRYMQYASQQQQQQQQDNANVNTANANGGQQVPVQMMGPGMGLGLNMGVAMGGGGTGSDWMQGMQNQMGGGMVYVNANGEFVSGNATAAAGQQQHHQHHQLQQQQQQNQQQHPASHPASPTSATTFNSNVHPQHSNSTPTSPLALSLGLGAMGLHSAHASRAASRVGSRVASPLGSRVGSPLGFGGV